MTAPTSTPEAREAAADTATEALRYHAQGRRGKIEVVPTKPCTTQRDLSLAYTPGVAAVCRAIDDDVERVFDYTARSNLVAVLSNGTAVLGLGNIGPEASKPVMEGKGILFKRFADVDVFDLEINAPDPQQFIELAAALEPTFGGINLEDIKAPECFEIETALRERMDIPVFHDDQHGTALIAAAALLNALALTEREMGDLARVVVSGAGAASIACLQLLEGLGLNRDAVWMFDSRGLIHEGRDNLNRWKAAYARPAADDTDLAGAMAGADFFFGLSVGGVLTRDMVASMALQPIVFALANPDPEIPYDEARAVRDDIILATGRSDHPNQVNNVLGFPFIFRGALDCVARDINLDMKLAAARALAELAREPAPESVRRAYGGEALSFGPDYLIPKPFDPRVLSRVAPAVAHAAGETGLARRPIDDIEAYAASLEARIAPIKGLVGRSPGPRADRQVRVIEQQGEVRRHWQHIFARGGWTPEWLRASNDRAVCNLIRQCATGIGAEDQVLAVELDNLAELLRELQSIGAARGFHSTAALAHVVAFRYRTMLVACPIATEPSVTALSGVAHTAVRTARTLALEPRIAFVDDALGRGPMRSAIRAAAKTIAAEEPRLPVQTLAANKLVRRAHGVNLATDVSSDEPNVVVFANAEVALSGSSLLGTLGSAQVLGPFVVGAGAPMVVWSSQDPPGELVDLVRLAQQIA